MNKYYSIVDYPHNETRHSFCHIINIRASTMQLNIFCTIYIFDQIFIPIFELKRILFFVDLP